MTTDLLELHAATGCVYSPEGRMIRVNSPDAVPPPRMHLAGCESGWIVRFRDDVDDRAARAIEELVRREPPLRRPGTTPRFAEDYRALLGVAEPLSARNYGPVHLLPHGTRASSRIAIVRHNTPDGDALWTELAAGMPPGLAEAGFTSVDDFWAPWCAALVEGEIAAIAFAARLGGHGADIGVYTLAPYRGRGLAAAVTAAWSALPELRERTLFYSTHRDNLSSQRVIARLGLPYLGESMRL
ncbi:MAG: GNAT family N-acetyltransferase [Rhizomicrobium sp.]